MPALMKKLNLPEILLKNSNLQSRLFGKVITNAVSTSEKPEHEKENWTFRQRSKLSKGILSSCKVIISFSDKNLLFVERMRPKEEQDAKKLEQTMSKFAINSKPLKATPVVGEKVVASNQIQQKYCRAIVKKLQGSTVVVRYIDCGRDE